MIKLHQTGPGSGFNEYKVSRVRTKQWDPLLIQLRKKLNNNNEELRTETREWATSVGDGARWVYPFCVVLSLPLVSVSGLQRLLSCALWDYLLSFVQLNDDTLTSVENFCFSSMKNHMCSPNWNLIFLIVQILNLQDNHLCGVFTHCWIFAWMHHAYKGGKSSRRKIITNYARLIFLKQRFCVSTRGENENDVGFLYVFLNISETEILTKNNISKYLEIFFKQVVAERCIFFWFTFGIRSKSGYQFPSQEKFLCFLKSE